MFAGASRAVLTSVVFAFETTRQPLGLLPLLGGCAVSYLLSCLLMKNSIMTEKIVRRGTRVPGEQSIDFLELINAGAVCARAVIALRTSDGLAAARVSHLERASATPTTAFRCSTPRGLLAGVLTRRRRARPRQRRLASPRRADLAARPPTASKTARFA